MSAKPIKNRSELPQAELDDELLGFEFELHYDIHGKSLQDISDEILHDSSPSKHIHNWDKKLLPSPVHAVAKIGAKYLREKAYGLLVTHSTIEEVLPTSWANHGSTPAQAADDIDSRLFFAKKAPRKGTGSSSLNMIANQPGSAVPFQGLKFAQGRIIYIKEQVPYAERSTLLVLYTFCIRLQYEDYRYIHAFIARHLSLRSELKFPYFWQETSAPQLDGSLLKCYKRVSLSSHITYLTLNSGEEEKDNADELDRERLFLFEQIKGPVENITPPLFKASVSVLLTLVVPEESVSRAEEIKLLKTPQALWTVLVVNSSSTSNSYESRHFLTPIAQFVRGIVSSLQTQRVNALLIHNLLRDQLNSADNGDVFDDEKFTKSILYHWAIKTCDALIESLATTLRLIQGVLQSNVEKLCSEAHNQERVGVEHWQQQLKKEIFEMKDLHAQILALKGQVKESRDALHGVTAILEGRLALQQGERMKTLAYLATVYIPLTTSTAIYSMTVLPGSATLQSFFIVLAIFFLATIILIFNLGKLLKKIRRPRSSFVAKIRLPGSSVVISIPLPGFMMGIRPTIQVYIDRYTKMLTPSINYEFPPLGWRNLLWWMVRAPSIAILRYLLLPEIYMPMNQYYLYQMRNHVVLGVVRIPLWGILWNIIRGTLIPVWFIFVAIIICYQLALDLISLVFRSTIGVWVA